MVSKKDIEMLKKLVGKRITFKAYRKDDGTPFKFSGVVEAVESNGIVHFTKCSKVVFSKRRKK